MGLARIARALARVGRMERLRRHDFSSGLGGACWTIYGLVRSMRPAVAVEIGSAQGKSACFIGAAMRENGAGKLYAIDPHRPTGWNDNTKGDPFEVITKNLRRFGVQDVVEIVRKTSGEAAAGWREPIDLLFIDGDHSYEGVKLDWELFSPFVSPNGIVIFHDTLWDHQKSSPIYRADMGVPRFVDELRRRGYPVVTLPHDFGVSLVQPVVGGLVLTSAG